MEIPIGIAPRNPGVELQKPFGDQSPQKRTDVILVTLDQIGLRHAIQERRERRRVRGQVGDATQFLDWRQGPERLHVRHVQ